jgi:hypothetical protein
MLGAKPHAPKPHAPKAAAPEAASPAAQANTAPSPVPAASEHPGRWGRVDADGGVFLLSDGAEHKVGEWQAGTPDEGLAHFARRFDDIRTEVELLHARLSSGSGDPKAAATSAKHVKDSLADAAVIGDLPALTARIDEVLALSDGAQEQVKQAKEAAKQEAVARKQALATEAEDIAENSTQWKAAGDRLRAILDEWKTIKGIDRKTDDALWKRFSKSREGFNRRRGAHFAELDKQRGAAKARKAELVEQAEKMSASTDWGPTAARFKDMMAEWKAAGRAPKDTDDALWQRFRGAQDKFFGARSAAFSERDAEFGENAKQKEALIAEAEKIDPAQQGLGPAKASLRRIQDKWEEVGKVPRERIKELEGKFKAVEDRVRSAEDARWRRTDPEAEARAAQFRERVEQFESQAAKARSAGDERRAKKFDEQAAQWREWLRTAESAVSDR